MKRTINRILSSNLALRLLSVILSVCLWMLIINANDPDSTRTFSSIDVTIRNENVLTDQGMCYRVVEGSQVSFSIKGKKSIVDKIKKSDFEVYADFSELSSVNAVPIHIVSKKYANDITIMNNNDKTMVLHVEKAETVKVPVEIDMKGKPEVGYSVGESIATPNAIMITGPQSEVTKVVLAKVMVDVSGATKDINTQKIPACYDKNGEELKTQDWEFSVNKIVIKIVVGQSKSIPVRVRTEGNPAEGYQIALTECSPSTVQLKGKKDALNQMEELILPEISVEDAKDSIIKEFKASSLKIPKGVSFLDPDLVFKVNITINKEAQHELEVAASEIYIDGKTQDMSVVFLDKSVTLRFTGTLDSQTSLSVATIKPTIDVSGLKEGEYNLELKLLPVAGLVVKESPQIQVRIYMTGSGDEDDAQDDTRDE